MNSYNPKKDQDIDDELISKSELKRQMHTLQKMGESLLSLPTKQFQSLSLGEELQEAIRIAKDMKNDNGRRRQIQRIGKLMRFEDLEAIKEQLSTTIKTEQHHQKNLKDQQQKIADIYDSLINSNDGLTRFIESNPKANRQLFRQLMTNIKKEKAVDDKKPSKNTKRLMEEISALVNNEHDAGQ